MHCNFKWESIHEIYDKYKGNTCEITTDRAFLNQYNWIIVDTIIDDILTKPLSMKEIIKSTSIENSYIHGNVLVDINEMIDNDLEGFLDLLAIRLVDNECLMDITYKVIDITQDELIVIQVSGDVSEIMKLSDEMIEELKTSLFMCDKDVIEDFADMDLSSYEDKDVLDGILDDVIMQMPDDELISFYRQYVN